MSARRQAGPRDGWGMLAHAIELVHHPLHTTIVGPGVAVRLEPSGEHVALAYGGHRGRVDERAVRQSAAANLEHWPALISRLEILVEEREGRLAGLISAHDHRAIIAAKAKRARKAARWKTGAN